MAQGLGQDAMAKRLFISPKTLATHAQNILTKLGVHRRAEAVALAYRAGLIEERDKGTRPS
jgi:DNA-binding CsgD family transcriptional regulator